ncbi:MAG: hypothetical protein CUR33_02965 [Pseudomonas sp.]|nr:MAG: hypothetical protein CUR33_02965 [Pseudomonas sp.] [Pseudomonas sp. FEMGT703P]
MQRDEVVLAEGGGRVHGRAPSRPLKNVGEAASARQKQAKKRSLRAVNEHFETPCLGLFLTPQWQRR